jgi:uncharacterized protein YkwD
MRRLNSSIRLIALLGILFTAAWLIASPARGAATRAGAELAPGNTIYAPLMVRQPTATPLPPPTATPPPPGPEWLAYLNTFRAMADLPGVTENPEWSYGDALHARYIVKNDVLSHTEEPSNPWYTPEGAAAAQSGNLAAHSLVDPGDGWAFDTWMQSPFHAVGVLDPQLLQVGYGTYGEADGGLQMAAGLDVLRGLGALPPTVHFPVMWPSDGTAVPLTTHWGTYPSALSACPGYETPAGLPIILQLGSGDLVPQVTGSSFASGGTPLAHCVFGETTYVNPDPSQQSLGRAILDARDAVVLIPRDPLTPGAHYTVSLTVGGQTHTWSFTAAP